MANIKTGRMALGKIRQMLEDGLAYKEISRYSGYPVSAISIMANCWGLGRKRGPKPRKAI